MTTLSHLYVVESEGGLVKIGYSAKPKKRIAQIEMSIGTSVVNQYVSPRCLNARKMERHLHQHFDKQRQQGEWFSVKFQAVIKEIKRQTFQTDEPNRVMPFEFGDYQLRTFVDKNGEPWFCLKDACDILNVGNPSDVVKRLQKRGVVSIEVAFKRSVARFNFVDEANFYRVIFQSRKKDAAMFQNWVFEEVLPSIRKTGQYSLTKKPLEKKLEQADFEVFIKDCFIQEPTHITRSRDIYLVYQGWGKAKRLSNSHHPMGRHAIRQTGLSSMQMSA
jgi:prophage antirepressor-like protein